MWKMEPMKCQEVRRILSLVAAGDVPLTEWAIIQTHLLGCPECRQEFEQARARALERIRGKRRRVVGATLAAATAVLLVMAVGGLYVYRGSLPELSLDSLGWPTWPATPPPAPTAAPPPPATKPPAPVVPATAAPAPPPAPSRPRPAVEPRIVAPPVAPTAEPAPRAPRRAAGGEAVLGEAMPTQTGAPARSAPTSAEPMPTQAPSRPVPPPRQ
jgi:hypothetical protein